MDTVFFVRLNAASAYSFSSSPLNYIQFHLRFLQIRSSEFSNGKDIKTFSGKNLTSDIKKLLPCFSFILFIFRRIKLNNAYLKFCRNNRQTVFWNDWQNIFLHHGCNCQICCNVTLTSEQSAVQPGLFLYPFGFPPCSF